MIITRKFPVNSRSVVVNIAHTAVKVDRHNGKCRVLAASSSFGVCGRIRPCGHTCIRLVVIIEDITGIRRAPPDNLVCQVSNVEAVHMPVAVANYLCAVGGKGIAVI